MIDKIKKSISIIDIATQMGAEPKKLSGSAIQTKFNPLRDERTSSLVLYPSTNTWHDFGSTEGGDVIDFYAAAKGIDNRDAIIELASDNGITFEKKDIIAYSSKIEYIKPDIVEKIFEKQIPFDAKKHAKELSAIYPIWLYNEASSEDRELIESIIRFDAQDKSRNPTSVVLLKDETGTPRTIRYRRKPVGNGEIKWKSLKGAQSSVHYTRLKDSAFTIIVEGTHDYITATLAGYSVIAIPSARFKIDQELLQDSLCVFIDDDDGKNHMRETFDAAVCDKILFDHGEFKKIHSIETAKDFSDYIYNFSSLTEFKNAFDSFIQSSKKEANKHFLDIIGGGITVDMLENIPIEKSIYDGFIYENNINMIVADGGVGKSILSLAICRHALEKKLCDHVLYLDTDNGASTLKSRIPNLLESFGEKMRYYGLLNKEPDDIIAIIDTLGAIRENNERVIVVIDSLFSFVEGTLNDDAIIKPFMDKIKKLRDNFKATVILLHHVRKPDKLEKFPTFQGSVTIKNAVDTAWAMIREKKEVTIKKLKGRPIDSREMFTIDVNLQEMRIESDSNVDEESIEQNEDQNDAEKIELIKDAMAKCGDISKSDFLRNTKIDGITKKDMNRIMKDTSYKDVHWRYIPSYKDNSGKQNFYIVPIFDEPRPAIAEYEYNMSAEDIELMDLF